MFHHTCDHLLLAHIRATALQRVPVLVLLQLRTTVTLGHHTLLTFLRPSNLHTLYHRKVQLDTADLLLHQGQSMHRQLQQYRKLSKT